MKASECASNLKWLNFVLQQEDGKRDRRAHKKRPRRHHGQISSSASSTPPTPQLTPTYNHPPDPYTIAATYPQVSLNTTLWILFLVYSHQENVSKDLLYMEYLFVASAGHNWWEWDDKKDTQKLIRCWEGERTTLCWMGE